MALAEDVARFADEIRQASEDISTQVNTFPSGAVSLRIRANGRVFDLDYLPSHGMFGVDELEGDAAFDTGYRHGFRDFEFAKAKMLNLLRGDYHPRAPDESPSMTVQIPRPGVHSSP